MNMRRHLETVLKQIEEGKLDNAKELLDTMDKYMKKMSGGAPACCHSTFRLKDGKEIELRSEEGELITDCYYIKDEHERFKKRCFECQAYIIEQVPKLYARLAEEKGDKE